MNVAKTPTGEPAFFSAEVAEARRFYLDLNPASDGEVVVVCGGLEHCTPDYMIQRETFPFYSIEYVARGSGTARLQDRDVVLQPGRLFAYGPGVPHRITGEPANPLVKYFVSIAGAESVAMLRSCALLPGRALEVHPPTALQPLFDELIEVGRSGRRGREKLCRKLMECLTLRIASARAPLAGAETLAFTTYHQCRQYIEKHFRSLRTLEEIAGNCHVNSAYLCRLFRRYDHQSPYQFLLRLKMNLAAERLQQPGALVKQVAEESGFADPFHFSRVFKRTLGLAPDVFRKMR